MFNKIYDSSRKFLKQNWRFLIFWIVILFIIFFKLPYVIYSPGGVIDLTERINIDNGYESEGRFEMTYVTMRRGNIPNVLISFLLPNWDLEKEEKITMDGQNLEETMKIDRLQMQEAIDNATILAYRKAGKEITITKENANVIYISKEAKTNIELLDKIISIDGEKVSSLKEMQNIVKIHKPGDLISIVVERDGKEKSVTAEVYDLNGESKIGLAVTTSYDYETDPAISFKSKSTESGPSGGFMMSLAIYNSLIEDDITHGKTVVGTGTIDIEGNVGKIDGVKYKLLGASNKKADVFLCPVENKDEALKIKEEKNLKIEIMAISTFDEAINYLNTLK